MEGEFWVFVWSNASCLSPGLELIKSSWGQVFQSCVTMSNMNGDFCVPSWPILRQSSNPWLIQCSCVLLVLIILEGALRTWRGAAPPDSQSAVCLCILKMLPSQVLGNQMTALCFKCLMKLFFPVCRIFYIFFDVWACFISNALNC